MNDPPMTALRTIGSRSPPSAGAKATGALRFRSPDGTWMLVTVGADLMLLDEHTTACVVLSVAPG